MSLFAVPRTTYTTTSTTTSTASRSDDPTVRRTRILCLDTPTNDIVDGPVTAGLQANTFAWGILATMSEHERPTESSYFLETPYGLVLVVNDSVITPVVGASIRMENRCMNLMQQQPKKLGLEFIPLILAH